MKTTVSCPTKYSTLKNPTLNFSWHCICLLSGFHVLIFSAPGYKQVGALTCSLLIQFVLFRAVPCFHVCSLQLMYIGIATYSPAVALEAGWYKYKLYWGWNFGQYPLNSLYKFQPPSPMPQQISCVQLSFINETIIMHTSFIWDHTNYMLELSQWAGIHFMDITGQIKLFLLF